MGRVAAVHRTLGAGFRIIRRLVIMAFGGLDVLLGGCGMIAGCRFFKVHWRRWGVAWCVSLLEELDLLRHKLH